MACSFVSVGGYAGCAVLALHGELDVTDAAELSSRLAAVVSREPWVIVDLADLTLIDSSTLRLLAVWRERARLAGGDVLLAGPRAAVARQLTLTGLAEVFPVFPGTGLAAFSAGLAALGARLAAPRAGESLAAAGEGMVTAAGSPDAATTPAQLVT